MAKAVFRPGELVNVPETLMIETPVRFDEFPDLQAKESEEAEFEDEPVVKERDVYTGPTADDMRREAEEFKSRWETEKNSLIETARTEAEQIKLSAAAGAEDERRQAGEEAETLKTAAGEEAAAIVAQAQKQADELAAETRKTLDAEKAAAVEQGMEAGRTEGFAQGNAEVERLVERTRTVLERAQDKRGEILAETEQEIIELVLLMCRKVVKAISESQREVVVSNVVQALRKVKDRGNIIIRVNLADLKLATAHTQNFIKMMEGAKSIQVAEDSSVDPGGCIIETDFGEIDARISSQLSELEAKIREVSPIRARPKSGTAAGR